MTGPGPDNTIPSGSYPAPTSPNGIGNWGYPFPVQGPTQPPAADPTSSEYAPTVPVEYQPPYIRPGDPAYPQYPDGYDPTYGGIAPGNTTPGSPCPPHHPRMPNDPFKTHLREQETEFGWGEGMYPDPILDYSAGGSRSRFPIADPDARQQHMYLAAIRRMDVSDPFARPDPYVAGNPDRFGAGPPLVRKRGRYKPAKRHIPKPPRMRREW